MYDLDCNKRWDIIGNILSEMNYEGIDWYEYDDSDEDNHKFLIVQSWSDIETFNEIFKKLYPNYKVNLSESDSSAIIDELTHYNWGFSDEYTTCTSCNKVIYYNEWGRVNYAAIDCEMICMDCFHKDIDFQRSYCENMENNPRQAVVNLTDEELLSLGYERIDGEYANGWYGRMNSPDDILNKLLKDNPNEKFIFVITNMHQFETEFVIWKKNNRGNE